MAVTAMRARDVILAAERRADSDRNRLLAAVEMRQTGHDSTFIKLIHMVFEQPDSHHLAIGVDPKNFGQCLSVRGLTAGGCHFATSVWTPDIRASTLKITAKSIFAKPMPRAAVSNSLVTAVVGTGTSSLRPNSIASSMSFCIMFTSNHASCGCCNTNGPR